MKTLARTRTWLGLATLLAFLVAGSPHVAGATGISVLRYAEKNASDAYTLKLIKTCEVGDGLAVVNNLGATPLRLTSISVLYGDGASAHQANSTFELVSLRRGTSEGQLGASFNLSKVDGGVNMGSAVGNVVEPYSSSGRSYDIVAKVLVTADHKKPWKITGLRVTYTVGSRSYATVLAQSITLSSTPVC
jgi:hypothetical protein